MKLPNQRHVIGLAGALVTFVSLAACTPAKAPGPLSKPKVAGTPASAIETKTKTCSVAKPTSDDADVVERVELEGNRRISSDDICNYLKTRAGKTLDELGVTRDVRELWASGLFDDIEVESRVVAGKRSLIFRVRERPSVHAVTLTQTALSGPALAAASAEVGKAGTILDFGTLRLQVARIREVYVENGYGAAEVNTQVTPIAGNQVDIELKVTEGARQKIVALRFPGADPSRIAALTALLDTEKGSTNAVGGVYRPTRFERGLLDINSYYWDRGMVTVQLSPVEVTLAPDRTSLTLVVPIVEGDVYAFGTIGCAGDLAMSEADCVALLGVKKGDIFSRKRMMEGVARLVSAQTKGGHGTSIDPQSDVDTTKHTVALRLVVSK